MQRNSYKFILVFLFLALTMSFVSAHNVNITFYDESTLSVIPEVTITDANTSVYTSDINGLWTTDLVSAKSFEISKTGYDSRPLKFYFNADANYNFLLNPTSLDSNIGFIVKNSNNNLWTNKYLMFKGGTRYPTTEHLEDSNSTEVSEYGQGDIYVLKKTFNYDNSPKYISKITNSIKVDYGSTCRIRINFNYNNIIPDSNVNYSQGCSSNVWYNDINYINPNPNYPVYSIKLYIFRTGNNTYSEKNTNIYSNANYLTGFNIINSLLTSSSGTATANLPITAFINNDYNALLYDETGTYVEPATLIPYIIKLNFSEDVNATLYTSEYTEQFENVSNLIFASNSLPINEEIKIIFNNEFQEFSWINNLTTYIDQNIFVINDMNSENSKIINVGVKEEKGNIDITNAIIKNYIVNNNSWVLINQKITNNDGKETFFVKNNTTHYFNASKNGYDDDYIITNITPYFEDTTKILTLYLKKEGFVYKTNYRFYAKEYLPKIDDYYYIQNDKNITFILNTLYQFGSIAIKIYDENGLVDTKNSLYNYIEIKYLFDANKNYQIKAYINDEEMSTIIIKGKINDETLPEIITENQEIEQEGKNLFIFVILIIAIIIVSTITEYYFGVGVLTFFILTIIASIWELNMLYILACGIIWIIVQIIKGIYGD